MNLYEEQSSSDQIFFLTKTKNTTNYFTSTNNKIIERNLSLHVAGVAN